MSTSNSNSSRLPVPSLRYTHDSPPVKTRKALEEVTGTVNQSPTFSKTLNTSANSNPISAKKIQSMPNSLPHTQNTGIPAPRMLELPKQRRPKAMVTSASLQSSTARQSLRAFSDANSKVPSSSKLAVHSRTGVRSTSLGMQDPEVLKRQFKNQENLMKMISVQRERVDHTEKLIAESKKKSDELEKRRYDIQRSISTFKTKISDAEVSLINVDHKLGMAKHAAVKERHHEEQMLTLKLKEDQNAMLRELDEFKAMMDQELEKARMYHDDESNKEIEALQSKLNVVSKDIGALRRANDKEYGAEKDKLEKELNYLIYEEEKKGEASTKKYETTAQELSDLTESFEKTKMDVVTLESLNETLRDQIKHKEEIVSTSKSMTADLISQIEQLKKDNELIDGEVDQATEDAAAVDQKYQMSVTKMHKEKLFRQRIENSIDGMVGKLRVYARVLPTDASVLNISAVEEDPGVAVLSHGDETYFFNKVFSPQLSNHEISSESCSLVENALNGCNVSIIMSGSEDDTLTPVLLRQCLAALREREERYISKSWAFEYGIQITCITPNGVSDAMTSESSEIKLENRSVNSTASSTSPDNIPKFQTEENSSTLIKITITAKSPHKSFTSSIYILNLTRIESFDLIHNTTTKVSQNKFSTTEFEHSMYQLVHSLYSNTKVVTLVNIDDAESDENKKWLELTKFVSSVNSVPVKRVYSKITSI